MHANEEEFIDPSIFLEENRSKKTIRSRSATKVTPPVKPTLSKSIPPQRNTSLTETFLRHNRKHLPPSCDNDVGQQRHVQFRMNAKRGSQSAHVSRKSPPSNRFYLVPEVEWYFDEFDYPKQEHVESLTFF